MEIKVLINNENILTNTLPDDEFYLQCLLEEIENMIKFCNRDYKYSLKRNAL